MKFEKGKHKILPSFLFLGDTVITLMRYSSEVDLEKTWCKTVLSGREAGICHTPLSLEHMCWQRKKITDLASNCVQCLEGKAVARWRVSKCYFPPFLRAGRVPLQRPLPAQWQAPCCREHNSRGVVYGANLNLLCNCFLGKTVQIQLCSLLLQDYWSRLLFYCQHLLTPPPVGRLQSISPSKSHVPLPCQVWVARLGG